MSKRRWGRALAFLALLLLCTTAGCRPWYYLRLGYEQARFMATAQPLESAIAASDDPERRARLQLVEELRGWASRQGLAVEGNYSSVSNGRSLEGVHVVTAAWPDRLESWTWRYPVVGRLPYRGYFDRAPAEACARRLRKRGLDSRVARAAAYSTLGWFNDPLPESLVEVDETALVVVLLHELVHSTVFIRGQADFNESLAQAVSLRLGQDFFSQRGSVELARRVQARRVRWIERGRLLAELETGLLELFERCSREGCKQAELMSLRSRVYADASDGLAELFSPTGNSRPGSRRGGGWPGLADNAAFLAVYRYHRQAEGLAAWAASWQHAGEALARLEKDCGGADSPWDIIGG